MGVGCGCLIIIIHVKGAWHGAQGLENAHENDRLKKERERGGGGVESPHLVGLLAYHSRNLFRALPWSDSHLDPGGTHVSTV